MRGFLLLLVLAIPLHLQAAPVDFKDLLPSEHSFAAQILLQRGGYLRGPVDGAFGKGSRAALDQFREDNRMFGMIGKGLSVLDLRVLQDAQGKVDSDDLPARRACNFPRGARVQFHYVNRWRQQTVEYGAVLAAKDAKVLVKIDSYLDVERGAVFSKRPKRSWIDCGDLELK